MLVGSDGHVWPGAPSVAHRSFVEFAAGEHLEETPKVVIYNGDLFDGSKISRHSPIGWENRPEVADELDVCKLRLGEIEDAAHPNARLIYNLGNHCLWFCSRLADRVPEFSRVKGFDLADHFSNRWAMTWVTFINDGPHGVVCKHKFKGGTHAAHNNALWAGRSFISGHLHSQKISAITNYSGTFWGCDTGCLAFPGGPQFTYTEGNPLDWRAGFGVFTFRGGKLLPPELVTVWNHERGEVCFRGKIIRV
jgi:hypothetical protein